MYHHLLVAYDDGVSTSPFPTAETVDRKSPSVTAQLPRHARPSGFLREADMLAPLTAARDLVVGELVSRRPAQVGGPVSTQMRWTTLYEVPTAYGG